MPSPPHPNKMYNKKPNHRKSAKHPYAKSMARTHKAISKFKYVNKEIHITA